MIALLLVVVHLHDINTILREQEDVDDHHDPPLINFQKWAHLKAKAMSTLQHHGRPPAYNEEGLGTAMEYLKAGLQDVSTEEYFHELLRANSEKLRENEERLMPTWAKTTAGF